MKRTIIALKILSFARSCFNAHLMLVGVHQIILPSCTTNDIVYRKSVNSCSDEQQFFSTKCQNISLYGLMLLLRA